VLNVRRITPIYICGKNKQLHECSHWVISIAYCQSVKLRTIAARAIAALGSAWMLCVIKISWSKYKYLNPDFALVVLG